MLPWTLRRIVSHLETIIECQERTMATIADLTNALNDLKATQDTIIADFKTAQAAIAQAAQVQAAADSQALDAALAQIAALKTNLSAAIQPVSK
jgi:hypothetical protein